MGIVALLFVVLICTGMLLSAHFSTIASMSRNFWQFSACLRAFVTLKKTLKQMAVT